MQLHTLFRPIQANGRVASNKYVELLTSPKLAPYVSSYWFSEPTFDNKDGDFLASSEEMVDRVIPDGCSDIILEQDLNKNKYRALHSGFLDEPFTISYNKQHPVRKFGVRFFPGGIFSLLGIPQNDFANSQFDMTLVWKGISNEIGDLIFEESSFANKVKIMEAYLISRMRTVIVLEDSVIHNLLYHIFSTRGRISVRELAEREVISTRHMNRLFYRWIGTSPKRFCEVVRFQSLIGDIQKSPSMDQDLAFNYGFFDQAHMMRDFKRFYGETMRIAIWILHVSERIEAKMKPRLTVITLGVDDLERSLAFYRDGLGLPTEGIVGQEFEHGAVAFFELEGGIKLAIFERSNLALDAKINQTQPNPAEFTLGHNVVSKDEVDKVMDEAKQAGATITVPAQDTFWGGYSGYFQDPDGHLWEVVWNPQWND